MTRVTRLFLFLISVSLAVPIQVSAQSNVDGNVYGEAVPGTTVSIEGIETGFRYETTVGSTGRYRISAVPAGRYKVSNKHAGGVTTEEITVSLGSGTQVNFAAAGDATQLETLQVSGAQIAPVDIARTETSFDIGEVQFDAIPIPRDSTSIALLAPGSVLGDNGFGRLASLGGSTVAENQYFVNGFNISDLRTRLGPSTVPFEFFQEFQVKTGGISAEFGRTTGGVINAVTKRGGNEWELGANMFYEPDGLREKKPDVYGATTASDFGPLYIHHEDELSTSNANLFGGGPILKDKLHFYALAQFRRVEENRVEKQQRFTRNWRKGDAYTERISTDPFYAAKLDWQIAPGHNAEYTLFSDRRDVDVTNFAYSRLTATRGVEQGPSVLEFGGDIHIARYTGMLTDFFKVSGLYGIAEANSSQLVGSQFASCPQVTDIATTTTETGLQGCFVANPIFDKDERTAYRLDFEWNLSSYDLLGQHIVRFGADREDNESLDNVRLAGDYRYAVVDGTNGTPVCGENSCSNDNAPADGTYVERTIFRAGGTFEEELSAFYLEDQWSVTPELTLSIGLRQESFKNTFPDGSVYADLEGDVAPRLGAAWDFLGHGTSKVYANYGRYYIPIGTQSSVRNGGGEYYQSQYYAFNGYAADATRTPQLGAQVGSSVTTANGEFTDVRVLVSPDINPSYQDEWVLGYETELPDMFGDNSVGGVRFIYRDLKETVEDIALDKGLNAVATAAAPGTYEMSDCEEDNGTGTPTPDTSFACGFDFYFLANPGSNAYTVFLPTNAAGEFINTHDPDTTLTAADTTVVDFVPVSVPNSVLGYPKPERQYYAMEFSYERRYDRKWFMGGSYTWSQSYGNYEGFVNSTIEQDDVAITQDFDQPGFTEYANGYLANDRRHKLKLFGSYSLTQEFQFGANLGVQSGRPVSKIGFYPDTTQPENGYNTFSFYAQNQPCPRGCGGRTPWLTNLDLSFSYVPSFLQSKFTAGLMVFNVLDSNKATEYNERADRAQGIANPAYGLASDTQTPRHVRLLLEYKL